MRDGGESTRPRIAGDVEAVEAQRSTIYQRRPMGAVARSMAPARSRLRLPAG